MKDDKLKQLVVEALHEWAATEQGRQAIGEVVFDAIAQYMPQYMEREV